MNEANCKMAVSHKRHIHNFSPFGFMKSGNDLHASVGVRKRRLAPVKSTGSARAIRDFCIMLITGMES